MKITKYDIGRYALAMALTMTAVGCSDNVFDGADDDIDVPTTGEREFNAYIDNGAGTRTSMGDLEDNKYPLVWSEGDKVLLAYFKNKYNATLLSGSGTQKAVFKGAYWTSNQHLTSVYPFDGADVATVSKSSGKLNGNSYWVRQITVTANLPQTQTYQKGTFANNVFPMVGLSTNQVDFYYENMAGVLQLPVKGNGTISKIILTGNDGETFAGEFNVKYNYTYWTKDANGNEDVVTVDNLEDQIADDNKEAACGRLITPVSGKSTGIITIDCGDDGLKLDPTTPTVINIAMLPTTFKKGFSVQFMDKDNGGSFEKRTTQPITVKRSYVKTMESFDYTQPEPLEPANCYVVDKAGYFMIPAFCMGNRPVSARLDVDANGTYGKTGNKVAADYLWTDVPGALSQIEYIPGKDGYISFKVNADADGNAPRGNTVVALYDSVTKEILWSWHIWMSDYNEVATNGKCRAGESTADGFTSDKSEKYLVIMDRNLGAVSADKNDGWKTYGLYYQMGRKDPFVGANTAGGASESLGTYYDKTHADENISTYDYFESTPFGDKTNHTEWNTNLTSGWTYNENFITAIYGYQHPMDFASSHDSKKKDTRWTTKELNTTEPFASNGNHEDFWNRSKTIKDPCPAGWTVLGENGDLYGKPTTETYYMSDGVYGIEATYNDKKTDWSSTVWWPASGFRSVDGTLGNIGIGGYYWHFDHIDNTHGGHGQSFEKKSDKNEYKFGEGAMTNHACVVRCVKARQQ